MKLNPHLAPSTYVFSKVENLDGIKMEDILCTFREAEGITLILMKEDALRYGLSFDYEAAWISLKLETSLEMVGLTAKFSQALAANGISCNVVAAYHHDHIFVAVADAENAIQTLESLDISV